MEVVTRGFRIGKVRRVRLNEDGQGRGDPRDREAALPLGPQRLDGPRRREGLHRRLAHRDQPRHAAGAADGAGRRHRLRARARPGRRRQEGHGGGQAGAPRGQEPRPSISTTRRATSSRRSRTSTGSPPGWSRRAGALDETLAQVGARVERGGRQTSRRSRRRCSGETAPPGQRRWSATGGRWSTTAGRTCAARRVRARGSATGCTATPAGRSSSRRPARPDRRTLQSALVPQRRAWTRSRSARRPAPATGRPHRPELPALLEKVNASLENVRTITEQLVPASREAAGVLRQGGELVEDTQALVRRTEELWPFRTDRRNRRPPSMSTAIRSRKPSGSWRRSWLLALAEAAAGCGGGAARRPRRRPSAPGGAGVRAAGRAWAKGDLRGGDRRPGARAARGPLGGGRGGDRAARARSGRAAPRRGRAGARRAAALEELLAEPPPLPYPGAGARRRRGSPGCSRSTRRTPPAARAGRRGRSSSAARPAARTRGRSSTSRRAPRSSPGTRGRRPPREEGPAAEPDRAGRGRAAPTPRGSSPTRSSALGRHAAAAAPTPPPSPWTSGSASRRRSSSTSLGLGRSGAGPGARRRGARLVRAGARRSPGRGRRGGRDGSGALLEALPPAR